MLKHATADEEGVYLRLRSADGSLFNVMKLQAYLKTLQQLIRQQLFAGDVVFIAHTKRALQRIASCLAEASELFVSR